MLWLRRSDVPSRIETPGSMKLGGITVYGESDASVRAEVDDVCNQIVKAAEEHLMVPREVLRHVVAQTGRDVSDKRLFGALLGRCLRLGQLDTFTCTANNGKSYWTLAHPSNFKRIDVILMDAVARVRASGRVTVKDLREAYFPENPWGSWYTVQNVLGRAVALGFCKQQDKSTYTCSEALRYARSQPAWKISDARGGRLDQDFKLV